MEGLQVLSSRLRTPSLAGESRCGGVGNTCRLAFVLPYFRDNGREQPHMTSIDFEI
jgi:hypothetical protein